MMTARRVSFDVMNLGRPINFANVEEYSKLATSPRKSVTFNNKEFVRMLRERTSALTDMYLGDCSENSDESEDEFAFLETPTERAHRMAFQNRRKKHYTEFTTVKLARKLISAEWLDMSGSESSFIHTENDKSNEECYECGETTEARHESIEIPRDTVTSNASNDSFKEESTPEPGFQPSHPCYRYLMGIAPNEAIPLEPVTPVSRPTSKTVSKIDIKDSKHSREFNPAAFPAFPPIPEDARPDEDKTRTSRPKAKHTRVTQGSRIFDLEILRRTKIPLLKTRPNEEPKPNVLQISMETNKNK